MVGVSIAEGNRRQQVLDKSVPTFPPMEHMQLKEAGFCLTHISQRRLIYYKYTRKINNIQ